MTCTRDEHRQGPPRPVVILLALLLIGLMLELGAGFALARHPVEGGSRSGASLNESYDGVTDGGPMGARPGWQHEPTRTTREDPSVRSPHDPRVRPIGRS